MTACGSARATGLIHDWKCSGPTDRPLGVHFIWALLVHEKGAYAGQKDACASRRLSLCVGGLGFWPAQVRPADCDSRITGRQRFEGFWDSARRMPGVSDRL